MSVALAAVALSASTAFAADASKSADAMRPAAGAMLKHRAMTREQMQTADRRLEQLLGVRPSAGTIDGSGIFVVCGDGLPSPGETCDDGNTNAGDGCSSTCQVEVPFFCSSATGTSPINDEGFELGGLLTNGTPNPNWAETGNIDLGGGTFFTPICSEEVCLGDPDAGLALEGEHFAWFGGGVGDGNVQTLTQTRTIAAGRPTLTFYTLRGVCDAGLTDTLVLAIDGNTVFTLPCTATDADWTLQSINLSTAPGGPYNNGASHQMRWTGTTNGDSGVDPEWTNIFVDFVNLSTGVYPAGVTAVVSVCNNDCGNGAPDGTEVCDDGNNDNGDGCSASCQVEDGFVCSPAVDGTIENAVNDGGYELGGQNDGGANPFWAEAFTANAFPPICSAATCGADIARTGAYFTWGGGGAGTGTAETQSVTQTTVIPAAATTLTFGTLRGICSPGGTDNLTVKIDGNTVFTQICNATDFDYVDQSVNLVTAPGGPYNNGASHTIVITSVATDATAGANDHTNFFTDDIEALTGVVIPPQPSVCKENCYSETFDTGVNAGDLTGWTLFNTGVLDVDWGTTDDGICGSSGNFPPGNYTGGSGEAACADSDQAGPGLVDAYLCSPLINYGAFPDPTLQLFVNYQVFGGFSGEDIFEVLSGTAAPSAGTIGTYTSLFATGANLGALAGPGVVLSGDITPQNGYLCFHYAADFDWYAMVDDVSISASSCDAGVDTDGDGLSDSADNCKFVDNNGQPNTGVSQNDTDADGIGNMCDADFTQTCTVDFVDLGEIKSVFFQAGNLEENMNGTGSVDFVDLGLFKAEFFKNYTITNPSGIPNVCNP